MKKKGFTLIELLTTIVVLGILALITSPIITNVINDARKNTFKNSAYGIVQAANQYYLNSKLTGESFDEITFTVNNDKLTSENKELSFSGKSPIGSSYVKINSAGEIAMNITDGTYYATKEYDEAGVLITSEEANATTREELANRITELETLLNSKIEELTSNDEQLNNKIEELTSNDEQLNNKIENNTNLINSSTDISNIENIFLKTYPVGSIYISTSSANPSTTYGGTWERYGNGKALVGVNESETEFATVSKTGGAKTHTLTVNEIPSHNHNSKIYTTNNQNFEMATNGIRLSSASWVSKGETTAGSTGGDVCGITSNTGGSKAHNNLQPYITVYMWKRTA